MSSQQDRRGDPPVAGGQITARLQPLVADAVATLGFQLDSLDVRQAGRRRLVKVVVDVGEDTPGEQAGLDLDAIAEVSRVVSTVLDGCDSILNGPYTLEVTSPGVDRPLTRPRHWRRAHRRLVKLRRVDGGQQLARVGSCDESGVGLLIDGQLRWLPYADIAHAVIQVEFRQPSAEDLALLDGAAKEES